MVIPEWVQRRTRKWNRVIDFAFGSCGSSASVYFEAALPAAGKAIVTLLTFGADDVFRGMFRPKGVYGSCRRGRRRRLPGNHFIPELGEEIGKRLPGADEIKSRSFGATEKRLWILDGIAQRVLFWLMVGDVVTDFAYDWVQGVYKRDQGAIIGRAQFRRVGDRAITIGNTPPSWRWDTPGATECQQLIHGAFMGQVETEGEGMCNVAILWEITNPTSLNAMVGAFIVGEHPGQRAEAFVAAGANGTTGLTVQLTGKSRTWVWGLIPLDPLVGLRGRVLMASLIGLTKLAP